MNTSKDCLNIAGKHAERAKWGMVEHTRVVSQLVSAVENLT